MSINFHSICATNLECARPSFNLSDIIHSNTNRFDPLWAFSAFNPNSLYHQCLERSHSQYLDEVLNDLEEILQEIIQLSNQSILSIMGQLHRRLNIPTYVSFVTCRSFVPDEIIIEFAQKVILSSNSDTTIDKLLFDFDQESLIETRRPLLFPLKSFISSYPEWNEFIQELEFDDSIEVSIDVDRPQLIHHLPRLLNNTKIADQVDYLRDRLRNFTVETFRQFDLDPNLRENWCMQKFRTEIECSVQLALEPDFLDRSEQSKQQIQKLFERLRNFLFASNFTYNWNLNYLQSIKLVWLSVETCDEENLKSILKHRYYQRNKWFIEAQLNQFKYETQKPFVHSIYAPVVYYNRYSNQIMMSPAFLSQKALKFFNATDSFGIQNLAGIGFVLAHEIMHSVLPLDNTMRIIESQNCFNKFLSKQQSSTLINDQYLIEILVDLHAIRFLIEFAKLEFKLFDWNKFIEHFALPWCHLKPSFFNDGAHPPDEIRINTIIQLVSSLEEVEHCFIK